MALLEPRRYGWIPSTPDQNDAGYALAISLLDVRPAPFSDLREYSPGIYDQGPVGSCVGNGVSRAHDMARRKQGLPWMNPSRLMLYYGGREMEGSIEYDNGTAIRDVMKVLAKQGVCPESMWPYIPEKFADRPTPECYLEALKNQSLSYHSVAQNRFQLHIALTAGFPVVFGFSVYPSFETEEVAKTGVAQMPGWREKVLGGHCVVIVGHDDRVQRYTCANSWGVKWGDQGYFTIPYDYVENRNLAADFWALKLVEDGGG